LKKPFACFSTGKRLDGFVFNLWILEKQLSLGYQDLKTDCAVLIGQINSYLPPRKIGDSINLL
jgi:hypothetical protein